MRKIHLTQGFVLATLLILLLILSILSVHAMNSSLLQIKMSHNFLTNTQRAHDADRVLQQAESALERHNNSQCNLESASADYVLLMKNMGKLSSLTTCRIRLPNNKEGHYVIQSIQIVPDRCLDGKYIGHVAYYRLTAWIPEGILVQSTYAKLLGQRVLKPCEQYPKIPQSIRLSWRLLS